MDEVPTFVSTRGRIHKLRGSVAISISNYAPRWLPMEAWGALILTGLVALVIIALTMVFIFGRPHERTLRIEETQVSDPSVVMQPTERTCMFCLGPVAGTTCRELDCGCLVHVNCIHDWWRGSAKVRHVRPEMESGILQLDCMKCGTQQLVPWELMELHEDLVVTKGELLCADL